MDKFRFNFGETEKTTQTTLAAPVVGGVVGTVIAAKKRSKIKLSSKDNVPCKQRLTRNFWSIITLIPPGRLFRELP